MIKSLNVAAAALPGISAPHSVFRCVTRHIGLALHICLGQIQSVGQICLGNAAVAMCYSLSILVLDYLTTLTLTQLTNKASISLGCE